MARFSKQDVTPNQDGPGTEWRADLDGYTTSIVSMSADADLTPLLKGLPNDQCPSPHWGVVLRGSMWFRYDDHEDLLHEGDVFYIPPGHTSGASEGAEFVVFSPAETMAMVEEHMIQRAQELSGANH